MCYLPPFLLTLCHTCSVANLLVNGHPVWFKDGHDITLTVEDAYIWLTVNHSLDSESNPWRWVIGSNYSDDTSITLECILGTIDYIDDPTLCGNNWYRNSTLQPNVSSHSGVCDLGDTFVCIESGITQFQTYFSGQYKQYHKDVPYWVSTNDVNASALYQATRFNLFRLGFWPYFLIYAEADDHYEAVCPMELTSDEVFDFFVFGELPAERV